MRYLADFFQYGLKYPETGSAIHEHECLYNATARKLSCYSEEDLQGLLKDLIQLDHYIRSEIESRE